MGKKEENLEKHLTPKSSAFNSIFIILLGSNSLAFVIFLLFMVKNLPSDMDQSICQLLADCWPTIGSLAVICWPTVDRQTVQLS